MKYMLMVRYSPASRFEIYDMSDDLEEIANSTKELSYDDIHEAEIWQRIANVEFIPPQEATAKVNFV